MKRKTFVKKMMGLGIGRNAANWACRNGVSGINLVIREANEPTCYNITNAVPLRSNGLVMLRVKRIVLGESDS